MPVSGDASKALSRDLLSGIVQHVGRVADDASVAVYPPLSQGMSAAVAAHAASATIVVVKTWADTASGFCSTLEELKIAEAHVVGVVLV